MDRKSPSKDLIDLVKTGLPDDIKRRRTQRQFEDIADSVVERLMTFVNHEYRGLTDGDREAAMHEVVLTLEEADLTDQALFTDDADPVKLARRLRATVPARRVEAQLGEAGTRLYDVVLDECCDCLARIIVHLPQFQPRAAAETLSRLTGLADQVAAVLSRLPARSLTAPEGSSHDEEFTRRYLSLISESLDTLELFGVRFERFTRPQTTLSVAYISLNVSDERERRPDARAVPISDWREDHGRRGAVRVESALADQRLMLIRGEAGGGKSTLLRWLAVTAARGVFTGALENWNGSVPLLIKLRNYAGQPLPRPEELLDLTAPNLAGIMPKGWVHRHLWSGRALLLVDGVDEVTASQRAAVRQWLKGFIADFPNIRVVVTSRPAAATSDWLRAEGFSAIFLEQLGPAELRALIEHWHRAVRDCADLPCEPEKLPTYEARLLARMEATPHLRVLASSPLLAAMLCALNLDRETLPRDRMSLYGAALELLLETRDAKRNIPSASDISLPRDQRIHILQALAWHLSVSKRVELPKSTAQQVIEERLVGMPGVRADATAVLNHLLQRSGVIREPVPGRMDFAHRTVQEYLTAKQLADLGDMELLIGNAHRDQWRETVIMAAGHANEPLRQELITGLLDRAIAERRRSRQLKLLAVACLETLKSIPRELQERLDNCLAEFVPPRDANAARSLAAAGEPVLSRLPERLDDLSVAAASASIRTAYLINGPEALNVLAHYGDDPRPGVQQQLQQAWIYFDPEQYAQRVLTKAPPGRMVNISSLGQLNSVPLLGRKTVNLNVYVDSLPNFSFLRNHADVIRNLRIVIDPDGFGPDFAQLPNLPQLRDFSLRMPGLIGITFVDSLPSLETIQLPCLEIQDLTPLQRLGNLKQLGIEGARDINPSRLPRLADLTALNLNYTKATCDLAEFANAAPKLRRFQLAYCDWIRDLTALANLPLSELYLADSTGISDVTPLAELEDLEALSLPDLPVLDLKPFSTLKRLSTLWLGLCKRIPDLTPLAQLPRLRLLDITGLPPGVDVEPLGANRELTVQVSSGQVVRNAEALGRRLVMV